MQVPPAVESQVRLQASVPIPTSVRLVGCRVVGDARQGGWLLGLRSHGVRQTCPVRATSFRHVLPHVGGFPDLRVLGLRRHPRSIPRAVPVTRRLRWPGMGATAEPRVPHGSVSGFPLPCLRSCIPDFCGVLPSGASGASHVLVRLASCMPRPEDSGGPAPPRLHGGARLAFGSVNTLGVRHKRLVEAVPALQGARSPLRPPGFAVDASPILFAASFLATPPWTQDSLRVGG